MKGVKKRGGGLVLPEVLMYYYMIFYKKSSVKPSESCFEAVSSACVCKGIQKAPPKSEPSVA